MSSLFVFCELREVFWVIFFLKNHLAPEDWVQLLHFLMGDEWMG
jgi:hypothetical protein